MTTPDRELLELAAKAAGIEVVASGNDGLAVPPCNGFLQYTIWNPLTDDGDALRLMVMLRLLPRQGLNLVSVLRPDGGWNDENYRDHSDDACAATRCAIVIAAAEIGRDMK